MTINDYQDPPRACQDPCLWRTSKRDRTRFFHTPGHVTFWRIGECRQSMPQTPSLNAQWKVGPSIQHNTCLDEMYTFLHPPPIFNSVYSRGPFIPWMPPKTVPPTMWPDRLRGWHPDTWWLKSPFILLFFNLLKLNKFFLFPIFSLIFSVASPWTPVYSCIYISVFSSSKKKIKNQRLRSLRVRVRKIFERKTAARRTATRRTVARRDGAFRGVSTNFLNKASHLTAFYAWYYSSPHLPVTPAQLMRPGIGRNASCAVGDFA